jgi:hypothetical protein
MSYGKAVEEVWAWRENFEKELRNIPREQQVKYINETAQNACKRLGIKCRQAAPRVKQHA